MKQQSNTMSNTKTQAELVAEAREARAAFYAAKDALEAMPKPDLIIEPYTDDEGDDRVRVRCPGCGATEDHYADDDADSMILVAVDLSERWTAPSDFSPTLAEVGFSYGGREDYEGFTYLAFCCLTPVNLGMWKGGWR